MSGYDTAAIDVLMEAMDLGDKIGQLCQIDVNLLVNEEKTALRQDLLDHYIGSLGIGSVLNMIAADKPWTPQDYRAAVLQIQATAQHFGRPPVIWGLDSVHGANYLHGRVITPQPINLAATFNRTNAYLAGQWASQDTRLAGINWLFSPLLGLAWEPKWSRVYETFGEDPLVVQELALQMIRGIQEESHQDKAILPSRAAACAKHFLGYSIPHNGHDRSPSWLPNRHLYQYFLPPWQKVIGEVATVMESYTETDGVPNVGNREALINILRHRLGFDGVLVTDYQEIYNLHEWHHVAKNNSLAVLTAMQEGSVDMSMIPWDPDTMIEAIEHFMEQDQISAERIDTSARRVLELKQSLNMFDEILSMEDVAFDDPTEQDMQHALDMTTQSIVLAKNEANALPIDQSASLQVLVTGPTSNSLAYQSGGWTWEWQGVSNEKESDYFTYGETVLGALQKKNGLNWEVSYQCGVDIQGGDCEDAEDDSMGTSDNGSVLDTVKGWIGWGDNDPASYVAIERAINKAKDMDVVIICVGEENQTEKPGDIRSLRLPQGQYALVEGIKANTDAKIVLVYFGGRPRLLGDMVEHANAVFVGFLPGPHAGTSVADLMTGIVNPSARLPVTYPLYPDGGGVPYLHSVSDMCTNDDGQPAPHFDNVPCEVQWPFGHGLSYTSFHYSGLAVSPTSLVHVYQQDDPMLAVSVNVSNTGDRAGAETVMLFSFDDYRSTTPEFKRLRWFGKVWLAAGDSQTITVELSLADFKSIGPHDDKHYIYDNLEMRIGLGPYANCRSDVAGVDPEFGPDSPYCSPPIQLSTQENYVGACEAACDIWESTGCGRAEKMDSKMCWSMCASIHADPNLQMNNDGWGYNYVDCLESLVWNNDFHKHPHDCWKMTNFCRDVFATHDMDQLGHGDTPFQFRHSRFGPGYAALTLAVIAGIVSAVAIYKTVKGHFQKHRESQYGDVQFSGLPDGAFMD